MSKVPSKYFLLCVHYKSGSHEVPNVNLFEFIVLLVYCGKVLSSSTNKLKQNLNAFSREEYILQSATKLLRHCT